MAEDKNREPEAHTRDGGGGEPVPADDPRDESVKKLPPDEQAKRATPPTEGPAAAGSLPG